MFWQREYVREAVSMTLNDTYRLDLPEHGLLGSLLLRISGAQASGYGQTGADWRIIDELSKLQILLESSNICKSLTGYEVQALAFYDQGVMPPDTWRNYATNTQWCYLLLNFGRHLHDLDYGLDLAKFNNVEFQLTNTATSSDFSDLTLSVLAHYLRDASPSQFKGFLRTEEWRSWTTVADETKYSDLPTEFPIRRVMLQAIPGVDGSYVENTGMNNLMDDIELALDTGVTRVYKGGIDDLMRENYYDTGKVVLKGGFPYQSADNGIDISMGYVTEAIVGAGSQDGAVAATIATLESGRTSFTQKMETYEADSPGCLLVNGLAPFMTALFRFDHSPNAADWLDPAKRASVQLNIHTRNASSAASGRNAIVLDRLVRP